MGKSGRDWAPGLPNDEPLDVISYGSGWDGHITVQRDHSHPSGALSPFTKRTRIRSTSRRGYGGRGSES